MIAFGRRELRTVIPPRKQMPIGVERERDGRMTKAPLSDFRRQIQAAIFLALMHHDA